MTRRRRRLLLALVVSLAVLSLEFAWQKASVAGSTRGDTTRVTPVYDPPVLAGQMAVPVWCSGGVYGRVADQVVLTSSGHCGAEGDVVTDEQGTRGVLGPASHSATCAHPGYRCTASDMNYMVVAADRIPWGHLNEIDMGAGGYRTITPDTKPLECADIRDGDELEFNGRGIYRTGKVLAQREYLPPLAQDPVYFPCIVIADIQAWTGDSGGVVFVHGIPSGIASRRFGDLLGFTSLASGMAELGITMCVDPNCGLSRP